MIRKIFAILVLSTMFLGVAHARKVTGTVTCGLELLEGVIVTDGSNFTTTNFKGKFAFDINDNAEHLYIVTPAGYVADWSSGVPAFYQEAAGKKKFHFDLQKTAGGKDYNIVAIADPQTNTEEHFAKFSGKPLEDIIKTVKGLNGVSVGLALGDICWDELARLDDYRKEIVRAGIPFYPVVGNHDNSAWCQGDIDGSSLYRAKMGPENYAFFLGEDLVIVLDNIIYDTNFKHKVGYADHVIDWVRGLMRLVPAETEIYIAQHAPTCRGTKRIFQANRLLDHVRGHKVTFISGHTHVNHNFTIEKNITEHNVAAICGAWWDTELCTDGTPKGYKVFSKFGGKLSWYYKPVGQSRKHIAEAFGLGQMPKHPNSVVVNVWDWDPEWMVLWYEDGKEMGSMDQVNEISPSFTAQIEEAYKAYGEEIPGWKRGHPSPHYFAATPSRYAKRVTIVVESRFGQKWTRTVDLTGTVEKHASCKGSAASIENMVNQVNDGATFLALELEVSMDGVVAVAGGDGLLLEEAIDKVEEHVAATGRSTVGFNLEIHTADKAKEGKSIPYYHDHADYVMAGLWKRFLGDRLMITGSDYRSLNHLHEKYPEVDLAFKLYAQDVDTTEVMKRLKFTPAWVSAHASLITEEFIREWHGKGVRVAVWGMESQEEKDRIQSLAPDAVIY